MFYSNNKNRNNETLEHNEPLMSAVWAAALNTNANETESSPIKTNENSSAHTHSLTPLEAHRRVSMTTSHFSYLGKEKLLIIHIPKWQQDKRVANMTRQVGEKRGKRGVMDEESDALRNYITSQVESQI